ncbi:MAG: transglycosylase SLT domain-containing protein [Candidatus Hydrogenedentota bacterium]
MVSIFSTLYAFSVVLSTVSGVLPGKEAYLEARDFERAAKYSNAQTAHEACLEADGPLAPYALMGVARCRSRGGDRAGGIKDYRVLLNAYPDGPWVGMALAEMAESLRLEERFAEAAEAYSCILAQPLPSYWQDRYRWLAVQCLAEDPESKPRVLQLCRTLCAEARFSDTRLEAAKVLTESSEPEDRFEAAYAMVKLGAYKEASNLLPEADAVERGETRWEYLRARVLLGLRQVEEGRAVLEAIAAAQPNTKWARLALMHLARNLYAGGKRAEGKALLKRLLSRYPDSEEAAEALWRFAAMSRSREEEAARYYLGFADLFPKESRADRALLMAGRLYSDSGKNAEAIAAYGRLLERYPGSRFLADAAYLRGDLRERGGDKEGAAEDYELATTGDLGNFYVHRALERLREMGRDNPVKVGPSLRAWGKDSFVRPFAWKEGRLPEEENEEPTLARLVLFGRHGLEEGEWEAVALARTNPEPSVEVYEAVAAAGMPSIAFWLIGMRESESERNLYDPRWWRVQFPPAYWDDVTAVACETGLDPFLILAVARQESFFRTRVVSGAGATGVMQLMPETADWLASVEKGITRQHADDLTRPANSLRLGAYYLMRMIERSNGNLIYALASYNAGPGNVSKWIKNHPNTPPEVFLNAMPFTETRHFVKRVLGNYGAYHSLYPDGNDGE